MTSGFRPCSLFEARSGRSWYTCSLKHEREGGWGVNVLVGVDTAHDKCIVFVLGLLLYIGSEGRQDTSTWRDHKLQFSKGHDEPL